MGWLDWARGTTMDGAPVCGAASAGAGSETGAATCATAVVERSANAAAIAVGAGRMRGVWFFIAEQKLCAGMAGCFRGARFGAICWI